MCLFSFFQNRPHVLYLFVLSLILASLLAFGWTETWSFLQLPTMKPIFGDFRTVQGAIESIKMGYDPYVSNWYDPWSRPLNYSMLWVYIGRLFNISNENNYVYFVSFYISLYAFTFFCFLKKYPSFWLLLIFFSGSSLLIIERGNIDAIMFTLLFWTILNNFGAKLLLIYSGFVLKIYPIFASIILLRKKPFFFMIAFIALVFLVMNYREISSMAAATPINPAMSYGSSNLSKLIELQFNLNIPSIYISLLLISLVIIMRRLVDNLNFQKHCDKKMEDLFLIGSGIYVATFFLISNFDYRLIFLSFCIPCILSIKNLYIQKLTPLLIVISLNQFFLYKIFGLYGAFMNILSKVAILIILSIVLIQILNRNIINIYNCYKSK